MANVIKGTIRLFLKHDDRANFELVSPGGNVLLESEGYLPYVGILGGDDTAIEIDNETGKIIDWKPITSEEFDT